MKIERQILARVMSRYYHCVILTLVLLVLSSTSLLAQTTVSSLTALLPYVDDNNVNVTLSPGTYTIDESNVASFAVTNWQGNTAVLLFEGNNSTYTFTGVTINFDTDIFQEFGNISVIEIQITGNNNVLEDLTMVDTGSTHPSKTVQNIIIDGSDNKIEGFHLTVKGSYPYGYGDSFGKGGTNNTIGHKKHSECLVRGESNHVKNCTFIHRSYGHYIFMQGASNPTIEGCYVEGEMRSTDDMPAEDGTGSPADNIDFLTTWGYKLPAGYMMNTGEEEGIRAYNAGSTIIDSIEYSRGTSNPTVLDCTVKYMRGGVTLAHASGTISAENCTVSCSVPQYRYRSLAYFGDAQ